MSSRFENALALQKSGRLEDAIREFRLLAAETSDANGKAAALLNEVRYYASLGRLDEAGHVLQEVCELAPNDPEIRIHVSFVVANMSALRKEHENAALQYGSMLQEYAQLLATPEYLDFHEDIRLRRAIELVGSGRHREAVPFLSEAASFSTLKREDTQLAHLYLGIAYSEIADDDLAKQEFLRVISFNLVNDNEIQARYRVAIHYFTCRAFAQAKHQLETILNDYQSVVTTVPLKHVYEQLSRACHYLGETKNERDYAVMSRECSE